MHLNSGGASAESFLLCGAEFQTHIRAFCPSDAHHCQLCAAAAGSGGSQGLWTLTVADVAPNNTL